MQLMLAQQVALFCLQRLSKTTGLKTAWRPQNRELAVQRKCDEALKDQDPHDPRRFSSARR